MTTLIHGEAQNKKLVLSEATIATFGAAILLIGAVLWAVGSPLTEKTDFSVTYIGARMVHDGQGARLYDLAQQRKLKAALLPNAEPLIFEHPPFEAFFLSPLGGMSYHTAYLIWGLINISIWLALPWLLRPYVAVPQDNLGYMVLWLIFAPLGIALYQGQSSLLLLLLFTATFIELKRGRDFRAGFWLALGLFKFQFTLPFMVIFLLRKKWNFVAGFLLMASALAGVSVIAVGPQGILSYVRLLANIITHPANVSLGSANDMATVHGFVHGLFGHSSSGMTLLLLVGAISAALIWFAVWRWNEVAQEPARFDLAFAASIVISLVVGSHMFTHDLSPLLLAMFLVTTHLTRDCGLVRYLAWTTIILLWMPPLYFVLIASHRMYLLFPVLMMFLLTTTMLGVRPWTSTLEVQGALPNATD